MNSSPLISVIIPLYNGELFIAEALDSIARQAYPAIQTIVIDDGSTDNSAAVIKKHLLPVTYVYQSNQGPQFARNRGLELAQGNIISFLDTDDLWADDKLRVQVPLLAQCDVVVGQTELLNHNKPPFLFLNLAAGLYKKSVYQSIGGFDPELYSNDDLDWFFRAREKSIDLHVHPETVLYHRRHSDNLTKRDSQRNQHDFLQMLHKSLARRRVFGQTQMSQFSDYTPDSKKATN